VSYGYDRIRFTAPVFIGDTIRVRYEVTSVDDEKSLVRSTVTCLNDREEIVAVATHIIKLFPGGGPSHEA
jgi:acyl dehydratase